MIIEARLSTEDPSLHTTFLLVIIMVGFGAVFGLPSFIYGFGSFLLDNRQQVLISGTLALPFVFYEPVKEFVMHKFFSPGHETSALVLCGAIIFGVGATFGLASFIHSFGLFLFDNYEQVIITAILAWPLANFGLVHEYFMNFIYPDHDKTEAADSDETKSIETIDDDSLVGKTVAYSAANRSPESPLKEIQRVVSPSRVDKRGLATPSLISPVARKLSKKEKRVNAIMRAKKSMEPDAENVKAVLKKKGIR